MFLAYVFSLVVGGVFLGVSALLGAKDADAGGHDHGGFDKEAHHDGASDTHDVTWIPFLSLQFWMFAMAFFGLTGTVLEGFDLAGPIGTALSSGVLGLAAGLAASYSLHKLKHDKVESNVGASDFIGRSATVLLPIVRGQPGKVRIVVKGQLIDLLATTDEEQPIEPREEVLVIEMKEAVALVERRSTAEGLEAPASASAAPGRMEGRS